MMRMYPPQYPTFVEREENEIERERDRQTDRKRLRNK